MRRLGLLAVAGALAGCGMFDPPMLTACEGVIKDRLVSPAGYSRVSYSEANKPLTVEQFLNAKLIHTGQPPGQIDRTNAEYGEPTLFQMVIEYDAPNTFGVPLRSKQLCDYVDYKAEFEPRNNFFVRVDGETRVQWLVRSEKK